MELMTLRKENKSMEIYGVQVNYSEQKNQWKFMIKWRFMVKSMEIRRNNINNNGKIVLRYLN